MRNQLARTCFFPGDPGFAVVPRSGRGKFHDRGVVLVITLLLLFLLSVVGLAAVVSSSSDLMINGYYKNYRGSFYAADAGISMARQAIYTYFNNPNNAPSTWPTLQNVANSAGTNLATSAGTYVNGLYSSSTSLNTGSAANSVPASFTATATVTLPSAPLGIGSPVTDWQYVYNYTLTSTGSSLGSETAQITETGAITVNIVEGSGTASTTASFAAFGAFIDSFTACQGALVQGYLTGPMYVKGQWNLSTGSSPGYTFTDPVSETGSEFSYYDGGTCVNSATVPYTFSDKNTVNPSFQSGYNLNVTPVTLPANTFSQEWAVLDGKGCGEGSNVCNNLSSPAPPQPTNAQLDAVLKDVTQTPYPDGGVGSGVFLPYSCVAGVCSVNSNGGGVYVEGSGSGISTSVTLSTANGAGGASNPSAQVFTIAQTSGSTTASPVVTQVGSASCSTSGSGSHKTTTCTANFQQQTTTTTPTTFTTVTVDPASGAAGTTTVSAYTQNAYSIVTKTGSNSCSQSGTSDCSPTAPGSFSGGSTSNSSSNGATTNLSLNGVPQDLVTSTPQDATMIYVDGDVSISGPSSGAAIQNNSMVNLTSSGNITQTGNITYATEPVTTSANQKITGSNPACCTGDPADTLIPQYENMNQALGIFAANGNFILSPTTSGSNIETDASIAIISQAGESNSNIGHLETGNSVGVWTNIGGRMENRAASVSMSSSNVYFDRRFQARTNFAPPWFPSSTVTTNMLTNTITASSQANPPSRTSWQYQAGQ
jgi:hypothetical protein